MADRPDQVAVDPAELVRAELRGAPVWCVHLSPGHHTGFASTGTLRWYRAYLSGLRFVGAHRDAPLHRQLFQQSARGEGTSVR